jgi:hypothetical protein
MNLSSAAGNLVMVNHLIQFLEPMSKPTNEPTGEPNKRTELPNILTSKQGKYSLSEEQDAELPSKIIVSITQFTSNTSYTFEAFHGVSHIHVKYIVTGRVTFSDGQDSEIQSICLDESKPQPNKNNLDSTSFKKINRSSTHACLVLFSSFGAIGTELKCGVHPHQILATNSSKHGLRHDKKSERAGGKASTQPNSHKSNETHS